VFNTCILKGKGKNVNTYLKYLKKRNIEVLSMKYLSKDEYILKIYTKDLKKVEEIKSIFQIEVMRINGVCYLKEIIKKHSIFFIFFGLSILFLILSLTRITKVEVIHSDKKIRELLIENLKKYDIYPGRKKKTYEELTNIKKEILENYKDTLEWIEIENKGTTYQVRVEERILPETKKEEVKSDIVSSSYAIIKRIDATKGVIVKNVNDYVRPGDTIISGDIYLNETLKETKEATGTVMGEVWYKVQTEYPLYYEEEKETQKKKKVLTLTFLNHKIEFTWHKFKTKKIKSKTLLKTSIFNTTLSIENQKETNVIKQNLTKEEAVNAAIKKIEEKINSTLTEKEHIISIKKLKVEENNSKIIVETYVFVYKNIGITKPKENEE
jgi:similar to stage IV sporulation protein